MRSCGAERRGMKSRMRRMPVVSDTRQRLIEAASELFWERGYAAVGLAEIAATAGVRQGSLYHFFPSKDDLLLTVIERQSGLILGAIDAAMSRHALGRERVLAVAEFYVGFMERTGCGLGCPMANLAGEIGDSVPTAAARIASFNAALTDRIAGALLADGRDGVDEIAPAMVSLVQGAVMQARVSKGVAPIERAREMLGVMMDFAVSNAERELSVQGA